MLEKGVPVYVQLYSASVCEMGVLGQVHRRGKGGLHFTDEEIFKGVLSALTTSGSKFIELS